MESTSSRCESPPERAPAHDAEGQPRPLHSVASVNRWVAQRSVAALVFGLLRGDFRGPASMAVIRWLKQWWRGGSS
ncbi:MAG: hypothetical protein IIZ92_23855 [Aquincola sp.]|nr:hypothetical protein [Aquincola sp.]